jgi:hypothetical protein
VACLLLSTIQSGVAATAAGVLVLASADAAIKAETANAIPLAPNIV